MFLELEDGSLLNVTLVEKVEFRHQARTATVWSGGIVLMAESAIAYRYFTDKTRPDLFAIVKEG